MLKNDANSPWKESKNAVWKVEMPEAGSIEPGTKMSATTGATILKMRERIDDFKVSAEWLTRILKKESSTWKILPLRERQTDREREMLLLLWWWFQICIQNEKWMRERLNQWIIETQFGIDGQMAWKNPQSSSSSSSSWSSWSSWSSFENEIIKDWRHCRRCRSCWSWCRWRRKNARRRAQWASAERRRVRPVVGSRRWRRWRRRRRPLWLGAAPVCATAASLSAWAIGRPSTATTTSTPATPWTSWCWVLIGLRPVRGCRCRAPALHRWRRCDEFKPTPTQWIIINLHQ